MPVQFVQETSPGGNIGAALGQGLSQGLQSLVQNKMNTMLQQQQQHQTSQGLQALLPNVTPQEIQNLSMLPQDTLNLFVKQKLQEPGNAAYLQALQQTLGGQPMEGGIAGGVNAQQATKLAELGLKRQSLEAKQQLAEKKHEEAGQEKVQPFLHAQAQDFNNSKKIYALAKRMKENLDKNKVKWPGISGYLPDIAQRDKDVRKYIADSNQLVTLLAGSRKGQPTNFKIKLEALSKPQLNQPVETQEAILNDLLSSSKEVFNTQKQIAKLKEENGGKYPRDLETKLAELQNVQTSAQPEETKQLAVGETVEELPDASAYPNAEIEGPDGEILVSDGKKWNKKGK